MSSLLLQGQPGNETDELLHTARLQEYRSKSVKHPSVIQSIWLSPVMESKVWFWDQMGLTALENESSSLSLRLSEHYLLLLLR